MTNADGSHYTLSDIDKMRQQFATADVKVPDDAPYAYRPEAEGKGDPWAEPLQGGAQIAVESLGAAIADLSKMTHELFDRVEPCLADPGDRFAVGGLLPPGTADSASPLRKSIVALEHKVRDLQADVLYVLRRVEL